MLEKYKGYTTLQKSINEIKKLVHDTSIPISKFTTKNLNDSNVFNVGYYIFFEGLNLNEYERLISILFIHNKYNTIHVNNNTGLITIN